MSGQQVALALQVMGMDALAVAALSRKFEPSQAATARLVLDEFEHLMLRCARRRFAAAKHMA